MSNTMKVLFVCKNNQFRSQMAMAIYNKLTGTDNATSAGTYVGNLQNPEGETIEQYFATLDFFQMMEDYGMHVRKNRTQKISLKLLKKADVVISMAEEPFIPEFLRKSKKVIRWEIANPIFATREVSEKTYSVIFKLIEKLILEI